MIPSCGYWCIENTNGFDQRISIDGTPIACSGLDDDSCYPYGGICQQLTNVPECGGDRQSNDFSQGGFNRGCKNNQSSNYIEDDSVSACNFITHTSLCELNGWEFDDGQFLLDGEVVGNNISDTENCCCMQAIQQKIHVRQESSFHVVVNDRNFYGKNPETAGLDQMEYIAQQIVNNPECSMVDFNGNQNTIGFQGRSNAFFAPNLIYFYEDPDTGERGYTNDMCYDTQNCYEPFLNPNQIFPGTLGSGYHFVINGGPYTGTGVSPFGENCNLTFYGKRIQPSETGGIWLGNGLARQGFWGLAGKSMLEWLEGLTFYPGNSAGSITQWTSQAGGGNEPKTISEIYECGTHFNRILPMPYTSGFTHVENNDSFSWQDEADYTSFTLVANNLINGQSNTPIDEWPIASPMYFWDYQVNGFPTLDPNPTILIEWLFGSNVAFVDIDEVQNCVDGGDARLVLFEQDISVEDILDTDIELPDEFVDETYHQCLDLTSPDGLFDELCECSGLNADGEAITERFDECGICNGQNYYSTMGTCQCDEVNERTKLYGNESSAINYCYEQYKLINGDVDKNDITVDFVSEQKLEEFHCLRYIESSAEEDYKFHEGWIFYEECRDENVEYPYFGKYITSLTCNHSTLIELIYEFDSINFISLCQEFEQLDYYGNIDIYNDTILNRYSCLGRWEGTPGPNQNCKGICSSSSRLCSDLDAYENSQRYYPIYDSTACDFYDYFISSNCGICGGYDNNPNSGLCDCKGIPYGEDGFGYSVDKVCGQCIKGFEKLEPLNSWFACVPQDFENSVPCVSELFKNFSTETECYGIERGDLYESFDLCNNTCNNENWYCVSLEQLGECDGTNKPCYDSTRGLSQTWYQDTDSDGYGCEDVIEKSCIQKSYGYYQNNEAYFPIYCTDEQFPLFPGEGTECEQYGNIGGKAFFITKGMPPVNCQNPDNENCLWVHPIYSSNFNGTESGDPACQCTFPLQFTDDCGICQESENITSMDGCGVCPGQSYYDGQNNIGGEGEKACNGVCRVVYTNAGINQPVIDLCGVCEGDNDCVVCTNENSFNYPSDIVNPITCNWTNSQEVCETLGWQFDGTNYINPLGENVGSELIATDNCCCVEGINECPTWCLEDTIYENEGFVPYIEDENCPEWCLDGTGENNNFQSTNCPTWCNNDTSHNIIGYLPSTCPTWCLNDETYNDNQGFVPYVLDDQCPTWLTEADNDENCDDVGWEDPGTYSCATLADFLALTPNPPTFVECCIEQGGLLETFPSQPIGTDLWNYIGYTLSEPMLVSLAMITSYSGQLVNGDKVEGIMNESGTVGVATYNGDFNTWDGDFSFKPGSGYRFYAQDSNSPKDITWAESITITGCPDPEAYNTNQYWDSSIVIVEDNDPTCCIGDNYEYSYFDILYCNQSDGLNYNPNLENAPACRGSYRDCIYNDDSTSFIVDSMYNVNDLLFLKHFAQLNNIDWASEEELLSLPGTSQNWTGPRLTIFEYNGNGNQINLPYSIGIVNQLTQLKIINGNLNILPNSFKNILKSSGGNLNTLILNNIELSNETFTDVYTIESLSDISIIDFENNNLDSIPIQILQSDNYVETLRIGNNPITSIPSESDWINLGNLTTYGTLELSMNNLDFIDGFELPSYFWNISQLVPGLNDGTDYDWLYQTCQDKENYSSPTYSDQDLCPEGYQCTRFCHRGPKIVDLSNNILIKFYQNEEDKASVKDSGIFQLDINNNNYSNMPEIFPKGMMFLSVTDNQITTFTPNEDNQFQSFMPGLDIGPSYGLNRSGLQLLNLSNNQLTEINPIIFKEHYLQILNLSYNPGLASVIQEGYNGFDYLSLTETAPWYTDNYDESTFGFVSLRELDISFCSLNTLPFTREDGVTPINIYEFYENVDDNPKIEKVNIDGNSICELPFPDDYITLFDEGILVGVLAGDGYVGQSCENQFDFESWFQNRG